MSFMEWLITHLFKIEPMDEKTREEYLKNNSCCCRATEHKNCTLCINYIPSRETCYEDKLPSYEEPQFYVCEEYHYFPA